MTTIKELLEKLRMLKYDYDSMSTSLENAIDDIAYELEQAIAATLPTINDNTRYHDLFGTPERAARTLTVGDRHADCSECVIHEACHSSDIGCLVEEPDALLEWLRGDA